MQLTLYRHCRGLVRSSHPEIFSWRNKLETNWDRVGSIYWDRVDSIYWHRSCSNSWLFHYCHLAPGKKYWSVPAILIMCTKIIARQLARLVLVKFCICVCVWTFKLTSVHMAIGYRTECKSRISASVEYFKGSVMFNVGCRWPQVGKVSDPSAWVSRHPPCQRSSAKIFPERESQGKAHPVSRRARTKGRLFSHSVLLCNKRQRYVESEDWTLWPSLLQKEI